MTETLTIADTILTRLREKGGSVVDPNDEIVVALATECGVVDLLKFAEALHELRDNEMVLLHGNRSIELTERGWSEDVMPAPTTEREPAVSGAPDREEKEVTVPPPTREDRLETIVTYLRQQGGVFKSEDGKCATVIGEKLGLDGHMSNDLALLEERGLLMRDVRGKRTFSIALTDKALNGKAQQNGDGQPPIVTPPKRTPRRKGKGTARRKQSPAKARKPGVRKPKKSAAATAPRTVEAEISAIQIVLGELFKLDESGRRRVLRCVDEFMQAEEATK